MSSWLPNQPLYYRTSAQRTAQQGIGVTYKLTNEISGQNKVENIRSNQIGSEYYPLQQPNPSETKGVSTNYFAETKQPLNSSQTFKQQPKKQPSIHKQKANEKYTVNPRQSLNVKGRDEQKQVLKEFLKELYTYQSGEQILKRAHLQISDPYLSYMKSISRSLEQSKSVKLQLSNLQKRIRQIVSSREYSKPIISQILLYPLAQMTNAKKAFDKMIDDPLATASFPSEFFAREDVQRLSKLSNLRKQKNIESPTRQVKDLNKNTFLSKNIQDSLNQILENRYSPETERVKNYESQITRVISNFNAKFNELISKMNSPKKPESSARKTQLLLQNISKDVLAIRRQKSSTKYFQEQHAKILIQSQLPEKLYEQVKAYYNQFLQRPQQRPQTGKPTTKSPIIPRKQQSPKQQQDSRLLYEQFQSAKLKVATLQRQNEQLRSECAKLKQQSSNPRAIKTHVIGGSQNIIRLGDNKKQTQSREVKKYQDEVAEANKRITILEKNSEEARKKLENESEKVKRQLQQINSKLIEENTLLKNQHSESSVQVQKLKAQIDRAAKERQIGAKRQQQQLVRLREQNKNLKVIKTQYENEINQLKAERDRSQKLRQSNVKGEQAKLTQQLRKQKQAFQFYKNQSQRQLLATKKQVQQKQAHIKNYKNQIESLLREKQDKANRLSQVQQQFKEQQGKNSQLLKRITLSQQNNRSTAQTQKIIDALVKERDILSKQNKENTKLVQQQRRKNREAQAKGRQSQKLIESLLSKPQQQTAKQRQLQQRLIQTTKKSQQQLRQLRDKVNELLAQRQKTDKMIKTQQSQISQSKRVLSERTEIISNLGRQKQALLQKNQHLSTQNTSLRRQTEKPSPNKQQSNQILLLKEQLRFRDQTITSLNTQISSQQQRINELQTMNMDASEELINARKQIQELQSKVYSLQRNTGQLKEKDRLQKKSKDQQREIFILKTQITRLTQVPKGNQLKDKEINKLKLQIQEYEQKFQVSNRQMAKLRALIAQLEQKIKGRQKDSSKLKQSITLLQQQLKKKQGRITELSKQNQTTQPTSTIINKWQQQKPKQIANSRLALLQHQILYNRQQDKQFLLKSIQTHIRLEVVRSKLIYKFDPLNKTNFHQYIDQIPNILVIIKLQNGFLTAAYSEGAFVPRVQSDKDGLIFSVTNRKVYTLRDHNRRAISYDEYFLIFGNSQIRLRSLQNKLFSNFGINNGYYASNGDRIAVLLGEGNEREVDLQSYQIYQLIFA